MLINLFILQPMETDGNKRMGSVKRPPDPYDFDDDAGASDSLDSYKRKEEKDDSKAPGSVKSNQDLNSPSQPKKTDNLYTSEGLQPSPSDLNDIFASDSPVDDVS